MSIAFKFISWRPRSVPRPAEPSKASLGPKIEISKFSRISRFSKDFGGFSRIFDGKMEILKNIEIFRFSISDFFSKKIFSEIFFCSSKIVCQYLSVAYLGVLVASLRPQNHPQQVWGRKSKFQNFQDFQGFPRILEDFGGFSRKNRTKPKIKKMSR